jgi:hypothetical protein
LIAQEGKVLKRYQVLLPDWLEEYIHWGVEKYELSFSELIRLEICLSILLRTTYLYPDYELHITVEEILSTVANYPQQELSKDQIDHLTSKIYFEARKAVEFRLDQESGAESKKRST